MNILVRRSAALTLLILGSLFFAGCATRSGDAQEEDPTLVEAPPAEVAAAIEEAAPTPEETSKEEEPEVPIAVAETEHPTEAPNEIVVQGARNRHEEIHDLVTEGQAL